MPLIKTFVFTSRQKFCVSLRHNKGPDYGGETCKMFNSENATKNIPVTVTLVSGTVQTGNMIIAMTSDLPRTLNGDAKFLEFEDMSGERCFFSRLAIALITPTVVPKVRKPLASQPPCEQNVAG